MFEDVFFCTLRAIGFACLVFVVLCDFCVLLPLPLALSAAFLALLIQNPWSLFSKEPGCWQDQFYLGSLLTSSDRLRCLMPLSHKVSHISGYTWWISIVRDSLLVWIPLHCWHCLAAGSLLDQTMHHLRNVPPHMSFVLGFYVSIWGLLKHSFMRGPGADDVEQGIRALEINSNLTDVCCFTVEHQQGQKLENHRKAHTITYMVVDLLVYLGQTPEEQQSIRKHKTRNAALA